MQQSQVISPVDSHAIEPIPLPKPNPDDWQRQKFKRKRGKEGSKSWRRKRLHWRDVDREWQHFHRYWMKPVKKSSKTPT